MGDKEDYLTSYRVFFENFAATVNPEDQLPVNIAGYTITESELPGEVLYWTTQYLTEKQCPLTLMTPLRRIILDEVQIASKKQPNEFGYKSDESVYIALRLMQAVTARVNHVCLRYLDNSKLDTLPPPPPPAQRELKTVSCATKNSRRVMEDRHVEIGNLEALFGIETAEPTSFYAVYDGHAGSAAATYCAAHLHQYLVESPQFTVDLRRALKDAFLRTDDEFIRKSNQERANGGSTAVAVCVRARRLVAAWAGDSLALLAKRMKLMQLVRPHKPGRQDEKKRIEASGGTVIYWGTWRVNGQLAVSRAIGDAQYKPYVTARPELATVDLDGDEDFIVVACDGLWDFVSEDDVALAVYRQLADDPDDLKAVTKRLIVQAKRQGSADNISIIVVFLKDPRNIVAHNRQHMDLGLNNPLATAPPFAIETEACKRQANDMAIAEDTHAVHEAGDNGVDNSDSDSEDLGPETAVDADDIDADARNHVPEPPTPPADSVVEGHVDGALVDNVAESGEDSEDEWNYIKGEGEQDKEKSSEHEETPLSETPCQDNSVSESSSLDMNNSPLNPDAPVFVPGSVGGVDKLLAESPRKPLPMDDIDIPDVTQFETEAIVRPADLLNIDNCDQLNGHHNVSRDEVMNEQFNGNDKCNMDSLGFGFNVGIESDKVKDTSLIQDFERIQKDTTDFCNVQVFQSHTETNPFAVEGDELFERLKNKERDPMSMSFYQEKDDDTCERISKNDSHIDLNAVQLLPDSDDEDLQLNGGCDNDITGKENISPEQFSGPNERETSIQEPNNDMILNDRTEMINNLCSFHPESNFVDFGVTISNIQNFSDIEFGSSNNPQEAVVQTDTPESHKLLFEQIPEIPDGKCYEGGFANDDVHDPLESEKDIRVLTPQDIDVEQNTFISDTHSEIQDHIERMAPDEHFDAKETDVISISESPHGAVEATSPLPNAAPDIESLQENITPELTHDLQENFAVEIHQQIDADNAVTEKSIEAPTIEIDSDHLTPEAAVITEDELIADSPLPSESPLLPHAPQPAELSLPSESPVPEAMIAESPVPSHSPLASQSPAQDESLDSGELHDDLASQVMCQTPEFQSSDITTDKQTDLQQTESSQPTHNILPDEISPPSESPHQVETLPTVEPTLGVEKCELTQSPIPSDKFTKSPVLSDKQSHVDLQSSEIEVTESEIVVEEPFEAEDTDLRTHSPLPAEVPLPRESPLPGESPMPIESPVPLESPLTTESLPMDPQIQAESPLPSESPVVTKSPLIAESPVPSQSPHPVEPELSAESLIPVEVHLSSQSPHPDETFALVESSIATESPIPTESPLLTQSPTPTKAPDTSEDTAVSEITTGELDKVSKSPIPIESFEETLSTEPHVLVDTITPVESPVPSKSPVPDDSCLKADSSLPTESPLPVDSPLPSEFIQPTATSIMTMSPVPPEPLQAEESHVDESALQIKSPLPVQTGSSILPEGIEVESSLPASSTLPSDLKTDETVAESTIETQADIPVTISEPKDDVVPISIEKRVESFVLQESVIPAEHSKHYDYITQPEIAEEALSFSAVSGPAPDVVPDERPDAAHPSRVELVTDIDIGIPESHAQEICVPVTSEIRVDDAVQLPVATTPPPTPAIEPLADPPSDVAPVTEIGSTISASVSAGVAVAAATSAVAAAVVSKTKSTGPAKKSPTTPTTKLDAKTAKTTPKSATTSRTPVTATAANKKTETPRSATARTTATKPTTLTSKPPTPAAKSATPTAKSTTPATKSLTPATKPTSPVTKSMTSPIKSTTVSLKSTVTAATKTTTAATKTTTSATKVSAAGPKTTGPVKAAPSSRSTAPKLTSQPAKPAARATTAVKPPTTTRAPISKPAPKPAPTLAPRTAAPPKPKPKSTEKPLLNGDVKELKTATRPASRPVAAPTRLAPRASAPKPAASQPPKSGVTKPAAPRVPLDKQSKDLANKRLTAKAVPPRTAPFKTAPVKNATTKVSPKKPIESPKKEQIKDSLTNGVTDENIKPPPSPPLADNALLPDVIA